MAGTAMRDRESLPDEIIEAVVARVRDERAVSVSALRLGKLSGRAHAELLSTLARANLEHTGKAIRVPLREQVLAVVERAGAAGLPSKALAREVKGARSAAELALVMRELISDGKLVIVAEGKSQRVAAPGPQWLTEAELSAVTQIAEALAALVKATRTGKGKPRPTLDRGLFERPMRALQELAGWADAEPVRTALHAAFKVAPAQAGLVRVPDVVLALEIDYPRTTLLATLDSLAREGTVELRPESAIAGLSANDRARCPISLDGTPLSYARLLPGAHP